MADRRPNKEYGTNQGDIKGSGECQAHFDATVQRSIYR